MLFWLILFFIIVIGSFFLALRSMRDYQELPAADSISYGVFLIRNPQALTEQILTQLYQALAPEKLIISLERLYKGERQALIIYGPRQILNNFSQDLNLLELEEYSVKIDPDKSLAWETGFKDLPTTQDIDQFKLDLPKFNEDEQFFLQTVLQPDPATNSFQIVIRAVIIGDNLDRVKEFKNQILKNLESFNIIMLPQAYSNIQMIKFYQKRILTHISFEIMKKSPQKLASHLQIEQISKLFIVF